MDRIVWCPGDGDCCLYWVDVAVDDARTVGDGSVPDAQDKAIVRNENPKKDIIFVSFYNAVC